MINKRLLLGVLFFACLMVVAFWFLNQKDDVKTAEQSPKPIENVADDSPRILSTNPEIDNDSIIPTNVPIQINFNRALENDAELRVKIEPVASFKKILANNKKTAVITFEKPLELGASYTLSIGPETKFDGVGAWGQERVFHFRTIPYKGL